MTKYYAAKKEKNKRVCTCCGCEYFAFPSAYRVTCGDPQCKARVVSAKVKTHRMSGSRLYNIWCGMKARVKGTAGGLAIKYYAGLTLAEEWRQFEAFQDWSLTNGYQDSLEIDRKDNTKGYGPDNCRWATRSQQMRNTRTRRQSNKTSKYKGVQYVSHCKKKWRAIATFNKKPLHIGMFETEEEAAIAYDQWVIKTHGEFCNPNFPQGGV